MTDEKLLREIETYVCGEVPDLSGGPRLEDWSVHISRRGKEYLMSLLGDVHDNPRFLDGASIQTSAVMWFDRKHRFVRTRNTVYALGKQAGGG